MHSGVPRMPIDSEAICGKARFYWFPMMVNSLSDQNQCHYLHSSPSYLHSFRMFLQTSPLTADFFSLLLFIFSSPPTSVFIPLSSWTVFDGSKSPHLSFTNTHFLSPHTHTQKRRVSPSIVSCPTELLSDYVKQKRVRKRADLNRGLISMCLLIRLLSVSYHWGQCWSPTDSNTSSTPDTCGKNRPQSQSVRQALV